MDCGEIVIKKEPLDTEMTICTENNNQYIDEINIHSGTLSNIELLAFSDDIVKKEFDFIEGEQDYSNYSKIFEEPIERLDEKCFIKIEEIEIKSEVECDSITGNHQSWNDSQLEKAVAKVLSGYTVNFVSRKYQISKTILEREVRRKRNSKMIGIFSRNEELALRNLIKSICQIRYGLTKEQVCKIAYAFAVANKKKIDSWAKNKKATSHYICKFLGKYEIALKTPVQLTLCQAPSFNKFNVSYFFRDYLRIKNKYKLEAKDIYNLDEAYITINKLEKMTLVGIIGATGTYIPPFLIFPSKQIDEHMLRNTPPGSKVAATLGGCMNNTLFLPVLQHFAYHVKPTKDNPKLIILDNHEDHLSVDAFNFCKDNGILLLTLPPHCCHKMQPLEVDLFGPFKKYFNAACFRLASSRNEKELTYQNVGECVTEAFRLAFQPENIQNSFKATGIEPFNADIFSDEFFLPPLRDIPAFQNTLIINKTPVVQNILKPTVKREIIMPCTKLQTSDSPARKHRQAPDSKKKVDKMEKSVNKEPKICFQCGKGQEYKLKEGVFCIVKVWTQKITNFRLHVAKINEICEDGYEVTFLKRYEETNLFAFTGACGFVLKKDIFLELSLPKRSTCRYADFISFNFNFKEFKFRVF